MFKNLILIFFFFLKMWSCVDHRRRPCWIPLSPASTDFLSQRRREAELHRSTEPVWSTQVETSSPSDSRDLEWMAWWGGDAHTHSCLVCMCSVWRLSHWSAASHTRGHVGCEAAAVINKHCFYGNEANETFLISRPDFRSAPTQQILVDVFFMYLFKKKLWKINSRVR